MKFEIGQKVMTPLGIGTITGTKPILYAKDVYKVEIKTKDRDFYIWFTQDIIKPYKTPYERLIEMGYECEERQDVKIYRHEGRVSSVRVYDDNTISCDDIYLELSRILTDYLEWLEEEK